MPDVFQLQYKALIDIETRGQEAALKDLRKAVQTSGIDKALVDAMEKSSKGIMLSMAGAIGKGIEAGISKADLDKLKGAMRDASSELASAQKEVLQAAVKIQEAQEQGAKAEVDAAVESYQIAVRKQQLLEKELKKRIKRENSWIDKRHEALKAAEDFQDKSMGERLGVFSKGVKEAFEMASKGDIQGLSGLFGKGGNVLTGMGVKAGMSGGAAASGAASGAAGGAAAGGGALAAVGGTLAAMAGPLAAIAAALALVGGAVYGVYKMFEAAYAQGKEFNKTLLEGAAAGDMMWGIQADGAAQMTEKMQEIRTAATDFFNNVKWGVLAEDQMKILKAMNETGLTFKELEGGYTRLAEGAEAYVDVTDVAIRYSKLLGVDADELGKHMAEWADELGGGLASVEEGFAKITKMAMESGFGVKRFYSMVQQATSGMALYNNRVEEAAALLQMTGDILGEQDAGDFIKTLTKGFSDESTKDRYKRIMITGAETTRKVLNDELAATASDMANKFQGPLKEALSHVGLDVEGTLGGGDLSTQLGKMSDEQRAKFMNKLGSLDKTAARKMDNLIDVQKGANGGIGDMANAMDDLGMVSTLQMKLAQVEGFFGKGISELSGAQRMFVEEQLGISGEEFKRLESIDSHLGNQMAELRSGTVPEALKDLVEIKNGVAYIKDTENAITENNQLARLQAEALSNTAAEMSSQEALAKATVEHTRDMSHIMKAGVQAVLEQIYQVLEGIYAKVMGLSDEERGAQKAAIDTQKAAIEASAATQQKMAAQLDEAVMAKRTTQGTGEQKAEAVAQALGMSGAGGKTADELIEARKNEIKQSEEAMKVRMALIDEIRATRKGFFEMGTTFDEGTITARAKKNVSSSSMHRRQLGEGSRTDLEMEGLAARAAAEKNYAGMKSGGQSAMMLGGALSHLPLVGSAALGAQTLGAGAQLYARKQEGDAETAAEINVVSSILDEEQARREAYEAEQAARESEIAKQAGDTADAIRDSDKDRIRDTQEALERDRRKAAAEQLASALNLSKDEKAGLMRGDARAVQAVQDMIAARGRTDLSGAAGIFGVSTAIDPAVQDFIYRGNSRGGTITPINKADEFIGAKPGGPVAKSMGAGQVTININGGDTAKIYDTVKRAMQNSGVR